MNYKTVALSREDFKRFIQTTREGFKTADGHTVRPNQRIATILTVQGNLGLRIGDVLQLKLQDFIQDGELKGRKRYRLDIVEEKTGKKREHSVTQELYVFLMEYAAANNIAPNRRLFPCSVRIVQRHVALVSAYLGMSRISTHSFRKFFATEIYVNSGYNLVLVQTLLQHCNTNITQRYIGIQDKQIEEALANHVCIV